MVCSLEQTRAKYVRETVKELPRVFFRTVWAQPVDDLDAVHAELDLQRDFGFAFVEESKLFEVYTQAATKQEYLLRPDLGRRLDADARLAGREARRRPRRLSVSAGVAH